MKNSGGFLVKEVNLEEAAKYIESVPAYRQIKRKIDFVRDRIRTVTSDKIKFFLRDKLKQLIEEKKKIMAVAFYEKYGRKANVAVMTLNQARKQAMKIGKNINNKNKSLLK